MQKKKEHFFSSWSKIAFCVVKSWNNSKNEFKMIKYAYTPFTKNSNYLNINI